MIKPVKLAEQNTAFGLGLFNKKNVDEGNPNESAILQNTVETRVRQRIDRTGSAFTEYTKKGFIGDRNSDFYEFLSLGIVPYLIGSGMFMGLFNLVNNHLLPKNRQIGSTVGKKMALGVVLYGLFKSLTPDLVTRPVSYYTGVDIELPYRHVYVPLPTEPGDELYPLRQQRKVYDSREFFRKDLIEHQEGYGKAYYDKIAKKIGLGENLNDSVSETTPIIQSIISTTKTAKTLSSYAWAGVGVALAAQDAWTDFFDSISNRQRYVGKAGESFGGKIGAKLKNFGHNTCDITKTFFKSFGRSFKSLWNGAPDKSGFKKHAGKLFILLASALTVCGTINTIWKAKHMGKLANKDIIEKDKESTVI